MFDNQSTIGNTTSGQFFEGTPVYSLDGEKIGTVSEHNVHGQYLIAHKGWLFPQDVYIPLTAIDRADAEGVYLRYSKDEALSQDWGAPPRLAQSDTWADTAAAETAATHTMAETSDQTDVRVPVREEELVASKRTAEQGRVRVHKEVIEEQQTVTVPVMREEVHVERVPVEGDAAQVDADAFTEKDIEVPVMREEAVVGKRAHVAEEVRLHKEAVTENQQVSDTVRKERVVVDGADEDEVTQDATTATRGRTIR